LAAAVSAYEPVLLHGGMTAGDRHHAARAFNSGRASLLLATDAASEGLNLHQRCRLVINLELPWTPVRLEQRVGRVDRIGQTLRVHAVHLLSAGTNEEESVARLMVTRERISTAVSGFQDLRSAAEAEAARLEIIRRLVQVRLTTEPTYDRRPCITVLKRRGGDRPSLWIYHLGMVDAEGQFVWGTLLGIAATIDAVPERTRDLRTCVGSDERLSSFASVAHQRLLADAAQSLRASVMLGMRRERAIVDTLTDQRARLAAALLQRGLFDRRAERTAAAQTAIVDEALGRCVVRLHALDLLTRIAAEPVDVRFTALSR
jgi:helicase-like protein